MNVIRHLLAFVVGICAGIALPAATFTLGGRSDGVVVGPLLVAEIAGGAIVGVALAALSRFAAGVRLFGLGWALGAIGVVVFVYESLSHMKIDL